MKRTISLIICFTLIIASVMAFTACQKEEEEPVVGGWVTAESPVITPEFQKVFEEAVADIDGVHYVPVAYLASQVVAGTNHCVLCKASAVYPDAKATYSILYLYEDLKGNVEITDIITDSKDTQIEEGVVGGWTEPTTPEMTDDAKKALEKACETLTGAEYTPIALLATQVVSGTNYRIICESKPSVPSPESEYVIVTVYADLKGNAEIIDIIDFQKEDISEEPIAEPVAATDGNIKTYYEMSDGTWMCDDITYQYRLVISGRIPNAEKDTTFIYLSNKKDISFEQAWKASGLSSDSKDYFDTKDAVLVELNDK